MQLSDFIRENEEDILREWEAFASRLRSAPDEMSLDALRDHARDMLRFIVERVDEDSGFPRVQGRAAAEAHGSERMHWGFKLGDMVEEFRALRATVTRLWGKKVERVDLDELLRFNEAIDYELSKSVCNYVGETEREAHLLETMLSYSPDQSYIFEPDGRVLYANRALAEAYGKHPGEIIGKKVDSLDSEFAAEVHRQIEQVLKTGQEYRGDLTTTTSEGDVHVVEYLFAPILDQHGQVEAIAGNSRDITARKTWERTLWKHANHDHLTGIPNRRLFMDRLEQDMRLAKRAGGLLALLYVDLDKFKDANDYLGHEGGDLLLRQAAERVASCIRETDTLARMGGDEFTVILVGAGDENHVKAVARAILTRLSRPYRIDGETVSISGSIGIALYPAHGETVDEITSHADQAMYSVKSAGGDAYAFFDPAEQLHRQPDKRVIGPPGRHH